MKKRYIAAMLVVTLICAMAGVGTMAWFTSKATSNDNTFKTGTLILGTGAEGTTDNDQEHVFPNVTFGNMEPGQPPEKVQTTVLKNVGSLPFYLYRITASELVDNNPDNGKDDLVLDDVITVEITIDGEPVYSQKLSELVKENGGFFEPIFKVQPQDVKDMVITASMIEDAGNDYQNLSMKCDFTVYARQTEYPVPGEGNTGSNKYYFGRANGVGTILNPSFSVEGYYDDNYIYFDWDWMPNDIAYEYYEIEIKHEKGGVDNTIEAQRVRIYTPRFDEDDYVEVTGDGPLTIDNVYVDVDKGAHGDEDIVRIEKAPLLNAGWKGFEVKLSGTRTEGTTPQVITAGDGSVYHYWSIVPRE